MINNYISVVLLHYKILICQLTVLFSIEKHFCVDRRINVFVICTMLINKFFIITLIIGLKIRQLDGNRDSASSLC